MSDDGFYWTVELEELFIKEFGNDKHKHDILGIGQENRPKASEADNGEAVQGQQSTTVLPSGKND